MDAAVSGGGRGSEGGRELGRGEVRNVVPK